MPEVPGLAAATERSSASLQSLCHSSSSSEGVPTTKTRVMSAKQPESRSRGKRSRQIGSSGAIGPEPMSWPTAVCEPCETMNSSAKAPLAVNACSTASLIRSQVSCSPSSSRLPFWRTAARSSSRAASIAASAACWARRIPAISASFFTRRRRANCSRSARDLDAVRAQVVCDLQRERRRHDGALDPEAPRRAQDHLELDLLAREALRVELVDPELLVGQSVQPRRDLRQAVELERAQDDALLAALLRVEKRVRDRERHLVAHLGRADRVGIDENVCHGGGDRDI